MRYLALAALTFALCVAMAPWSADAKAARPHIPAGASYESARQRLVQQGFDPVRILDRGAGNPTCDPVGTNAMCRAWPELLNCAGTGRNPCEFLYRRRADGKFWVVVTYGEAGAPPKEDLRDVTIVGDGPARRTDLEGLVILRPDGHRHRFVYPKEPSRDEDTPLCSETAGRLPCWVKPPPGYRVKPARNP